MAFDLNKLKTKKQEFDTTYLNKLKSYLDSEEFEDTLQDCLEKVIENGRNSTPLSLVVFPEETDKISITLVLRQFGFKYEICNNESSTKIGDISAYLEIIENKLTELKLFYTKQFEENSMTKYDLSNNSETFDFIINLNFEE